MFLIALIMGLVEGLTEFIPVSSTGHLILTGHLMNFKGELASTFEIFIQLGAILAVVLIYWRRFLGLLPWKKGEGFSGLRGFSLLIVTSLPALVVGKLAHHAIKEHLFRPGTVAIGLAAGAVWILLAERKSGEVREGGLNQITWMQAFGIGLFQCLALWPGVSRSGATILGAMMLGLDRKTATEYSFFAAVPVLLAAGLYDLHKSAHLITSQDIPFFALGFFVSLVSAAFVIKLLITYVSKHTLRSFAWYRIGLAALVLIILGF